MVREVKSSNQIRRNLTIYCVHNHIVQCVALHPDESVLNIVVSHDIISSLFLVTSTYVFVCACVKYVHTHV